MSEHNGIIPRELHDKAEALVRDYGFNEHLLIGAIAAALEIERERCAKIAEDEDGALPMWGEHRNQCVADAVKKDIAAAIRKAEAA